MEHGVEGKMELLLWRHAEAEDRAGHDLERQLTAHGLKQAKSVAAWLLEHRPKHLRILASPAVRAVQTVEALGLEYEIEKKIAPDAAAADLLAAAGWPQAGGAVLLVGHQPTLGLLAASLLFGKETDLAFKKGALWWFARDGGETILKAVMPPGLAR